MRALPNDLDAEKALLCALLLYPSDIPGIDLHPSDFYDSRHRRLFQCMLDLVSDGKTPDLISVRAEYERRNDPKTEEPIAHYLSRLVGDEPLALDPAETAALIRDVSRQRKIQILLQRTLDEKWPNADEAIESVQAGLIEVQAAGPASKIGLITLDTIAETEVEYNPLIEGLVGDRESVIFTGPSGAGKSLIVNSMALTAGLPEPQKLWGLFQVSRPLRSLIIQSENSFNAQNKRLKMVFAANPELRKGAKNVLTTKINNDCRMAGLLTDYKFQELLLRLLAEAEADLLILDPLISFHDCDENDNAAMRQALDCLTLLCDKAEVAVILCHHFNRQNQTRGAAAIRDWASNFFLLEIEKRNGPSTVLKVTHDKSRNYQEVADFYLERTPDLNFLRVNKPESKEGKQVDAVVCSLNEMGGSTDKQKLLKMAVMKNLNCSEASARRAINSALEMKEIIITQGTGIGNPHGYRLPGEYF